MKNFTPILITAPLHRSGTTLVQGLLCSSNTSLIYGETSASELQTMIDLYPFKLSNIRFAGINRERKLEEVLMGNTNNWLPDLMPSFKKWLSKIEKDYFTLIFYLKKTLILSLSLIHI